MATANRLWLAVGIACVAALGCGGIAVIDVEPGGGGSGAQGAMGGTGGSAGSGGASEGMTCGGAHGDTCGQELFCDYQPSFCGSDGATGVCGLELGECSGLHKPVCACDGNTYANPCEANVAGFDINWSGGCPPPMAMFPCGVGFCDDSWLYCRVWLSDVPEWDHEYNCLSYPPQCGSLPTCDCMASEPCGNSCVDDGNGNLTLTCPGG